MDNDDIRSICTDVKFRKYKANEIIFEEGTVDNNIHCIIEGKVSVYTAISFSPIRTLSNGDVFGEISAATGKKRIATLVATSDSVLLQFRFMDKSLNLEALNKVYVNLIDLLSDKLEYANHSTLQI